jgi:hypothetical protein
MDLSAYVPRHKGDIETARAAVKLGYVALKPVIPQILEWHQDYNWPVAHVLNELYRDADSEVIPHLERILRSDDWSWKYWIISVVIPQLDIEVSQHFLPELTRLSQSPTNLERQNEIDEVAGAALRTMNEKKG